MVSVPVLNTSPVIVEWLQRGLSRRKFRHIRGTSRRFRLGTPFREFFQHDKDGNPKGAVVIILMDLPLADLTDGLIKARIARGLTQKELAEKLNIDERQIQRYESTRYQGAALRRLQEVADALNVKIREEITLER